MLLKIAAVLNGIIVGLAWLAAGLLLLLILNVSYDVAMRHIFKDSSIAMQELEWHLFAAMFLIGVAVAIKENGHVRVDLIYERLSARAQAAIDATGVLIFLLPFGALIAWYGYGHAMEAWEYGETSGDPGGLPHRWVIKSVIPISAIAFMVAGLAMLLKAIHVLLHGTTNDGQANDGNPIADALVLALLVGGGLAAYSQLNAEEVNNGLLQLREHWGIADNEMFGILLFGVALVALFAGFPVAFTFAGIALLFGVLAEGFELFAFMPFRIQSIMENTTLMAVPLFIYMGVVLQKTQLAKQLLESVGLLFGSMAGGLAIGTVVVGTLLAASTGVVGASVVAMGLIALPVMLEHGYRKDIATGTICASGTLGQIVPPSIVLILLGDVLQISVGDLFQAAVLPAVILIASYVVYILVRAKLQPDFAPPLKLAEGLDRKQILRQALLAIIPPLLLIVAVLGSIFGGIATPTESSALGAAGALLLALAYGQLQWRVIWDSARETVKVTAMVFAILLGATAFSMAFTYTGGDAVVEEWLLQLPGDKMGFLLLTMLAIFLLGFFIDFVEICFIIVPILAPVADALGIAPLWFAILIAMNLQTSFLTPPFGFSLFYLKGVAPPEVKTTDIYRGVLPFILLQGSVLASLLIFPEFYGLG